MNEQKIMVKLWNFFIGAYTDTTPFKGYFNTEKNVVSSVYEYDCVPLKYWIEFENGETYDATGNEYITIVFG